MCDDIWPDGLWRVRDRAHIYDTCEFCGHSAIQGVCTRLCEGSQADEADLAEAVKTDWLWLGRHHPLAVIDDTFERYFEDVLGRMPEPEECPL